MVLRTTPHHHPQPCGVSTTSHHHPQPYGINTVLKINGCSYLMPGTFHQVCKAMMYTREPGATRVCKTLACGAPALWPAKTPLLCWTPPPNASREISFWTLLALSAFLALNN